MAVKISQLRKALVLKGNDLFLIQQEDGTKSLCLEDLDKRYAIAKIKSSDMDISSDTVKIKLHNLSEEVIKAISGTAPVSPTVGDKTITENKIADGAVMNRTLGIGSVTNNIIRDFEISSEKMKDGSVTNRVIAYMAITNDKLSTRSVDTRVLADKSVTLEKLDDGIFNWDNIPQKPDTFPPAPHNHDDRYYTKGQINAMLDGTTGESGVHTHVYKSDVPSTVAVGGLPKGYIAPEGVDIGVLIDEMLHPYVPPAISLFGQPEVYVHERGTTISPITVVSRAIRGLEPITTMTMYKEGQVIKSQSFDYDYKGEYEVTYEDMNVNYNTNYRSSVTDGKTTVQSATRYYDFVYPLYIGDMAGHITEPTEVNVKNMDKKVVKASTQTVTYNIVDRRMCICVPPGWVIRNIIDPNNFDITPSFRQSTVQLSCLDGTTQEYRVYLSEPTTQSGFTVKFNI